MTAKPLDLATLRAIAQAAADSGVETVGITPPRLVAMCDEIEALRREVERLRSEVAQLGRALAESREFAGALHADLVKLEDRP
jgi:hypothetical protein